MSGFGFYYYIVLEYTWVTLDCWINEEDLFDTSFLFNRFCISDFPEYLGTLFISVGDIN